MGVQINGSTGAVTGTQSDWSGNVSIGGTLTYEDVTNIDAVGLVTARSGIEIGARPGVAASISSDGNMIVSGISTFGGAVNFGGAVTVTGTSTFGTSTLGNTTVSGSGGLTISSSGADLTMNTGGGIFTGDGGNATDPIVANVSDTNTGYFYPASDTLAVTTGGTERARITSGGLLKVNSTDGGSYHTIRLNTTTNNAIKDVVHVHSSVDSATAAAGYGVRLNFSGEQSNGNEYTFGGIAGLFSSTGANYGDLAFYSNSNGTNTERLRIKSNGQLLYSAASGDNTVISKRTNAAGSNGNYFFHLSVTDNNDNAVGSLGFHRDTAVDDSRFVLQTRKASGSITERLRITSTGKGSFGTGTSHLNNDTDGDRTSLKIGNQLHISGGVNANFRQGIYNNCWGQGQANFYQGTIAASGGDYRASALTFAYGGVQVWNDKATNTNWSAGAQITTMAQNFQVDNKGYMTVPNQVAFRVYGTGGNTTFDGEDIILTLNILNRDTCYNTSNGRFTAPVAGIYLFHFGFFPNSTGTYRIELKINGSAITNPYISGLNSNMGSGMPMPSAGQILNLSANDYVNIAVNGTMTNTYNGHTGFSGVLLA